MWKLFNGMNQFCIEDFLLSTVEVSWFTLLGWLVVYVQKEDFFVVVVIGFLCNLVHLNKDYVVDLCCWLLELESC